jgi:4'-phosphopantetheinyl transferase
MNITNQISNKTSDEYLISPGQVHVWFAFLDVNSFQIKKMLATLSVDEHERAMRFHFEKDKDRFIAAHGILRNLLGKYLEMNPSMIQFEYNSNGKPLLKPNQGSSILDFNLSHSGTIAVYAISCCGKIGVDIELIRHDIEVMEIGKRFFSEAEFNILKRFQHDKIHELFFQFWTRKEAILKAMGAGISFPMKKINVSLINENGMLPYDDHVNIRWYLHDLFPYPGYAAAIAIEGGRCDISCMNFTI